MWSVMVAWDIRTRILSFVACAYLHTQYIPTYHCTAHSLHVSCISVCMDNGCFGDSIEAIQLIDCY